MKFVVATVWAVALSAPMSALGQGIAEDRFYMSVSGMLVDQGDAEFDVDGLFDDGEWEFEDEGWGAALAIGQHFADSPFRMEFEYAYRHADAESIRAPVFGPNPVTADADLETQSFMVNAYIDLKLGDLPLGVYGGAGAGVALTRLDQRSIMGVPFDFDGTATSFAYQVLAGVTFELSDSAEIYGGVRYFDALEGDTVDISLDSDSMSFEAGIRFFF